MSMYAVVLYEYTDNADCTLIVEMWKGVGVPNIGRITVSYFLSNVFKKTINKLNMENTRYSIATNTDTAKTLYISGIKFKNN